MAFFAGAGAKQVIKQVTIWHLGQGFQKAGVPSAGVEGGYLIRSNHVDRYHHVTQGLHPRRA